MKLSSKNEIAQCIKDHFCDIKFSVTDVFDALENVERRHITNSCLNWEKSGAIKVVSKVRSKKGGSIQKVYQVLDIELVCPSMSAKERKAQMQKIYIENHRKFLEEQEQVGARINSFALGSNFSLSHFPQQGKLHIQEINI